MVAEKWILRAKDLIISAPDPLIWQVYIPGVVLAVHLLVNYDNVIVMNNVDLLILFSRSLLVSDNSDSQVIVPSHYCAGHCSFLVGTI